MPEVWAGQLGEIRAASPGNGTALTTTATFIQLPLKTSHIFITPRNFSTAVVARVFLNPWLVVLKTTDNMVTALDYSRAAQDADATTDIDVSSLSTLANGDFLLIGSHLPFRGVYVDVDGTNAAGTAALDVFYWEGRWTDASDTDGTFSTRVFAQDGLVYWTVSTTWQMAKLNDLYPNLPRLIPNSINGETTAYPMPLYWTRWSVDAAITDSSVTFNSMVSANRDTAYAELTLGQLFEERIKHGDIGGHGCVEALTDAGTANLIVNVATDHDGRFE